MAPNANGEDATRIFSTPTDPSATQSTVIIGAGIIGCATAYYLANSGNPKPDTIHLVEASPELFASASGKAGGFCTSDWFGPPTASLGALSFRLHQELADLHDGCTNWGYSRSTASSLMEGAQSYGAGGGDWLAEGGSRAQEAGAHVVGEKDGAPGWLMRGQGSESELISAEGGVAQVDPLRLSQFLLRQSIAKGVRLHHPAKAVRISQTEAGEMSGIRIQHSNGTEHKLPCTRLLITAGAWTPSVFSTLFPASPLRIGVQPFAGYSLVVKSPRWTKELESKGCHAIFTTMRSGISPEIFSRIGSDSGSEIYVAGLNPTNLPLPDLPTDAKVDKESISDLHRVAQNLLGSPSTKPSDLQILKEGLCFRPVTRRGIPILARVPDEKLGVSAASDGNARIKTKDGADGGVFVAAGHGPWGISHSLGTGKVMADMLEGKAKGELSADVRWLGLQ